jgi:hypothetical protein
VWDQSTEAPVTHLAPFEIQEAFMLYTLVVVLLLLWLIGMVSSYTLGGVLHLLLVVAVIIVLVRLISGRSVA